ncbi:MAG: UbiA-like polyprenyltransferase [Armatimonadota bacterium]|nr:UbiA-like polyprenyltransferase [Armatimonadota bacterium]
MTRPWAKLLVILEMIKFEHTVFALPFALASALVASHGLPSGRTLGLILMAMVGARSAAMAFNRIVDVRLDALNPRTANRALPRNLVSRGAAWALVVGGSAMLLIAACLLNPLACALSPVALAVVLGYSYSKRFTSLSHLWLGLALGIAPVGAWVAVKGEIGFPSMVLSAAVILWTAGFDIIYALQDLEFDRRFGLFSLPARMGPSRALLVSRAFHVGATILLILFGFLCKLGVWYYVGVGLAAGSLLYEQSIVSPDDLSRVNAAFFNANGVVSIAILAFVALDLYAR